MNLFLALVMGLPGAGPWFDQWAPPERPQARAAESSRKALALEQEPEMIKVRKLLAKLRAKGYEVSVR